MFKNLIKTFVISGLFILNFVLINSVNAGTETVTGTVDESDSFANDSSIICPGYYEVYAMSVTVTGSYTLSYNSVNFTHVGIEGGLAAVVTPSPSNSSFWLGFTDRWKDGTTHDTNNPVNLTAGTIYYLHMVTCTFPGVSYSLTIAGPGDIILAGNSGSGIVYPPDDRINWQYGDLNAVIYEHQDGVVVYCYDGTPWFAMLINQELVNSWDTSLPQHVPVLEVNEGNCHAAFYILDSGEYQINIWSYEGKLYEIIAANLNFRDAEMRYFDPNE